MASNIETGTHDLTRPSPHPRGESGRHRHEREGTVSADDVLARNGRPRLTTSQQLMARIRGAA